MKPTKDEISRVMKYLNSKRKKRTKAEMTEWAKEMNKKRWEKLSTD